MKKYLITCLFQILFLTICTITFSNKISNVFASSLENENVSQEPPAALSDLQNSSKEQLNYWASNLARFDGRDFDYITPERNQGSLGICWAYAAIGAMEANILRDGIDPAVNKNNLDLDEIEAAYIRFNRDGQNDPLYLTTNDKYSNTAWRSNGGHAHDAFMAMSQGYSPNNQKNYSYANDENIKKGITQSKYFVHGFKQIEHSKEAIKRAILEYGAVTMEYKAPQYAYQDYVYHSDGTSLGHASLIVGWDDSISKSKFRPNQPTSDGAWIVKNSWGPGGDDGVNGTCCFYLSYNSYLSNNLYVVDMDLKDNYQNIYYYDGQITDNETQYVTDAHGAIYEAKLSSATKQEQLVAVSFGIRNKNLTADIKVFKLSQVNPGNVNDLNNIPDSGTLIAHKEDVYFEDDGFYTVNFDQPINLEQGEYFSIVISGKDSNGNSLYPIYAFDDQESVNDMTYRKYNGVWTSFKSKGGLYADYSSSMCLRLRAITNTIPRQTSLGNDLKNARIELSSRFMYYEIGKEQIPEINVFLGETLLQKDQDYVITFLNNSKPGQATVEITGINNYFGTRMTTFEIAKPKSPPGALSGSIDVYNNITNLNQVPAPINWEWIDKNVNLKMGMSDFSYSLRYIGDDADCYQKITCSVKINKLNQAPPANVNLSTAIVEIIGEYTYTGKPITPNLKVIYEGHELNSGIDYTLSFQNNKNAGMASIVIKGNWKYIGQITKEFEIKKAEWPTSIPNETITVKGYFAVLKEIPLNCENWEWQEPNQQISDENVVAIAVYNGQDKDNYLNTQVKITIIYEMQKDITLIDKLELEQAEFVYDGGEKTPNIIAIDGNLELKKDQDYIVQYLDNKNAGQAKVIVNGINKYIGVKTFSFTILKASYPSEKPQDEMIVDRKITSLQAIALPQGWNWEDPNIKIDAETITVYAVYFDQENYKNYRVPIQITKEAPKDATKSLDIQLENSEFVYDGTAKTPKVIVKDEDMNFLEFGKDYDVEYQNNVFAGQGTAIVTFKNDYKGVKELSFTISKAEKPNIETTIHVDNGATKLSDISLPEGFVWEDESLKIIGNKLIAKAIYQGEDADSFLTKEIYFEIIIEEKDNAPQSNYRWLIFTSLLISLTIAGVGLIIIKYKRNRN